MRLLRVVFAAALVGMPTGAALAQSGSPVRLQARLTLGTIHGTVSDDRGGPLGGALVSALGATSATAITDTHGRFTLASLPPGDYQVRVHLDGFASTRRDYVHVGTAPAVIDHIQLHRLDSTVASRAIMAAGVTLPVGDTATPDDGSDTHAPSETVWRLRHIKRSVLKQDGEVVSILDAASQQSFSNGSIFERAFDSAANMAASFFTATPFSGEVNLLTTSAIADGSMLPNDFLQSGVAYMSIGAPMTGGRWDVRASLSQSEVSSWIVAGSFSSRLASTHAYTAGVSYSTQQFQSRNHPAGLAPVSDDSRAVGELYASDQWQMTPVFAIAYDARYAHYDYLRHGSLLSPKLGATVTPFDGVRVSVSAAQHMVAPGAEEFLTPATVGPWLPPERTFAPLAGEDLRVERGRFLDLAVERDLRPGWVVAARRFQQTVDNQLVTLFGIPVDGGPNSPGHYYVASAGGVDAEGWGVRITANPSARVKGTVDYSIARAHWLTRGDTTAVAVWTPQAIRPDTEDVHDLTGTLETEIPQTATRVFVLCKMNDAFPKGLEAVHPTLDYRFDVQLNQALPFMPFSSTTRWEVLVGVRNLFRDPTASGSIYDELLVVRPPKRVVGGVLVRF